MWNIQNGVLYDDRFPFFHLVSLKIHGNLREPENRRRFCRERGLDCVGLVTAEQVHGSAVAVVGAHDRGRIIPATDGLITGTPGMTLAIFTADCVPVFLADRGAGAVGVVHAGWRGLARGIIPEALSVFRREFGILPADLIAAIGPHIRQCCYRVGPELQKVFRLPDGEDALDLSAEAVRQLREGGVPDVSVAAHCTGHEDALFFSYRRDKSVERMMSLIRK